MINKIRDHGGVLFVDLRDEYGLTQCVVNSDNPKFKVIENIKLESVIKISGKVIKRSEDTVNKNLPTGEIEILSKKLKFLMSRNKYLFKWQ